MNNKFCLVMIGIFCLSTAQVLAQSIQVNQVDSLKLKNPAQLIREVFLSKVPAGAITNINVTLNGWNGNVNGTPNGSNSWNTNGVRGLGYFSKGTSNFPMENGLIMSPGDVKEAEGPNKNFQALSTSSGVAAYSGGAHDTDLETITNDIINAAILEFDFKPGARSMEFEYIFASEEYPAFVDSVFNDVFGFFVRDISSNPTHAKVNIATIHDPGISDDTIPVSINTVNSGRYPLIGWNGAMNFQYTGTPTKVSPYQDYFIKNPYTTDTVADADILGPYYNTTQFNGFTVKLKASITGLEPSHTYRLKLAVGNAKDQAYGSGVFLAAHSFMLGNTLSIFACNTENAKNVYKRAENNFLRIVRPEIEKNQYANVALVYGNASNDAINGVDYTTLDGQPLPASIPFPVGKDTLEIPFVIPDGATVGRNIKIQLVPLYTGAPTVEHSISIAISSITVYAGADITQSNSNEFTVVATNSSGTGNWSVVGDDDGVTIANPSSPTTQVTLDTSKRETATLRWTVTDGDCAYSDDVELKYGKAYLPVNPKIRFNPIPILIAN